MYPCTSFYNYIVDRKGDIHELVPLDFRIVKYYNVNVGSSSGSIYIAPISYYDKKIDNKINMTSECQKSLYNLIIYILCRLSHEFNTILNSDSIILKRDTKNIQYDFYKANVSQFLALKRNITHGINECRYTKDYKNMFKFL
jgi:hypothetical protein